jgi:hypothetical protein
VGINFHSFLIKHVFSWFLRHFLEIKSKKYREFDMSDTEGRILRSVAVDAVTSPHHSNHEASPSTVVTPALPPFPATTMTQNNNPTRATASRSRKLSETSIATLNNNQISETPRNTNGNPSRFYKKWLPIILGAVLIVFGLILVLLYIRSSK